MPCEVSGQLWMVNWLTTVIPDVRGRYSQHLCLELDPSPLIHICMSEVLLMMLL